MILYGISLMLHCFQNQAERFFFGIGAVVFRMGISCSGGWTRAGDFPQRDKISLPRDVPGSHHLPLVV